MPIMTSNGVLVNAANFAKINNLILNYETDSDGNVIYIGYAARGTDDAWPGWLLEKHVNGHVAGVGGVSTMRLSKQDQVWDNRASVEFL